MVTGAYLDLFVNMLRRREELLQKVVPQGGSDN
jgi:hypothetical protein